MNDIGLRIRELRVSKNLTQIEFCEKIGVSQANFSHIETKGVKISIGIIVKIISNFDISARWLLTGEGSMQKCERQPIDTFSERELIHSQQRTIENLSETLRNLLEKK